MNKTSKVKHLMPDCHGTHCIFAGSRGWMSGYKGVTVVGPGHHVCVDGSGLVGPDHPLHKNVISARMQFTANAETERVFEDVYEICMSCYKFLLEPAVIVESPIP